MFVTRPHPAPFSVDAATLAVGQALKDVDVDLSNEPGNVSELTMRARVLIPREENEPHIHFELAEHGGIDFIAVASVPIDGKEYLPVDSCLMEDGSLNPAILAQLGPCATRALQARVTRT